ncbi:MAG TPA: RHS repeat-associated core domain-containing protein [Rhodanobacteraceae bacterium]|nr:RHS repeat-associated core domain-containing protein [Rhodanobacteraceae bacterium]
MQTEYMFRHAKRVVRAWCNGLLVLSALALTAMPVAASAHDTVTYYYTDALHSAVVETNAQGQVLQTTHYAPYGQVLNQPLQDGPGYTGHEEDPGTGLVYMQQRYYDPVAGRFLSVDPVAVTADGGGFNRYWYANDNPYRYTDPNGRQVVVIAGACAVDPACDAAVAAGAVALGIAAKKAGDAAANYYDHVMQSQQAQATSSPALPKKLVGVQDAKSSQQGKRHNSGPLAPEHGGTNDAEKDYGKLTGGQSTSAPAGKGYKEGTRVGANGISLRPARGDKGPRIDIPANGNKPPETLHYPKPPPPPPKIDGG